MGGKRVAPMLQRFMRAVDGGDFAIPKGWSVLMRYPTEELGLMHPLPKNERTHTSRLHREFFLKYPLAKTQPLQLNGTQKPLVRQFVERQQELMRSQGISREAAMALTEREMSEQLDAVDGSGKGAGLYLKMAQQEEEAALHKATRSLYNARKEALSKD